MTHFDYKNSSSFACFEHEAIEHEKTKADLEYYKKLAEHRANEISKAVDAYNSLEKKFRAYHQDNFKDVKTFLVESHDQWKAFLEGLKEDTQ